MFRGMYQIKFHRDGHCITLPGNFYARLKGQTIHLFAADNKFLILHTKKDALLKENAPFIQTDNLRYLGARKLSEKSNRLYLSEKVKQLCGLNAAEEVIILGWIDCIEIMSPTQYKKLIESCSMIES